MGESQSMNYSPKTRSKSSSGNRPEPTIMKRRNLSFASTSSPWFRRNSFLSPSMIKSENFSVYESPNYFNDSSSFSIILLKECQGFVFNQDLFASSYQQLRSLANEKKYRALSFGDQRNRSNSNSRSGTSSRSSSCLSSPKPANERRQRRHTSHLEMRPSAFHKPGDILLESSAIQESDEEEDLMDQDRPPFEEDAVVDEYDEYEEYEELNDYGQSSGNRMYKVHVTEIIVNEDDDSIFPS